MTRFDLDAAAAEATRKHKPRARYEFTAGGRVFSLPHVSDLSLGEQYAIDAGRHVSVMRDVAEFAPDDPGSETDRREAGFLLAAILLEMRADQVAPLIATWLAHAGLQPGESGASST